MGRLFGILIWILLFVFMKGQIIFDDLDDKHRSVDLTLQLLRIELQQFSQGMERILMNKLDGIENSIEVKISSKIETQHRLLKDDVVSLTNRLSEKVDENISHLNAIAQTRELLIRQEMVSLATNLSGKVDEKITDLINISLIEQRLLRQEMVSFATNLSGKVDEKFIDFINITLTEQQLLRQEMVSVASKVETLLNNSEINRLKEREKVLDDIRNSSLYVTEQISSGEVIQIQLCNITYSDCNGILEKNPSLKGKNGVYNIRDSNKAKTVYCDMTTDNGGWTVIAVFWLE